MIEKRYDDWKQNEESLLQSIISALPVPSYPDTIECIAKAINFYFVQGLTTEIIGSKATASQDLTKFARKASIFAEEWIIFVDKLKLLARLFGKENELYYLDGSDELFVEQVYQRLHLASDVANDIAEEFGPVSKGRPKDYRLQILINKLTNIYLSLDAPLEFKSDNPKEKFGNTPYCNYMREALTVVGEYMEPCSGLVSRMYTFLKESNLQ